jgi:hypothetical protein
VNRRTRAVLLPVAGALLGLATVGGRADADGSVEVVQV